MKNHALLLASVATLAFVSSAARAAEDDDARKASAGSDIVVTAQRRADTARKEEQIAPNLVNIQSAETIAKYPDLNAAEALSRVPGVALSIDTAEGRFVNIRGLDGNLTARPSAGSCCSTPSPAAPISTAPAARWNSIPCRSARSTGSR